MCVSACLCGCVHVCVHTDALDDSDFGIEGGGEKNLLFSSRSLPSLPTPAPRGGDRTRLFPGDKELLTTSPELGEVGTEHAGSLLM